MRAQEAGRKPRAGRLARVAAALALGLLPLGCATEQPWDNGDPAIIARVKAELKSHSILVRYLDINSSDGVVTLSGAVESYEQRREVVRLISNMRGVKQLVCNLLIQE